MNRIKKFNELKSQTYFSAGHKLKELGHPTRASKLKKYSYETLKKEAAAAYTIQPLHIMNTENRRNRGYDSRRYDLHGDDYEAARMRRNNERRWKSKPSPNVTLDIKGDFYYKIWFDDVSFDFEAQDPNDYDMSLAFFVEVLPIKSNQQQEMKQHYIKQGHYGPWWPVSIFQMDIVPEQRGLGEDDWEVGNVHFVGLEERKPDLQIDRRMARKIKNDVLDMLSNENNPSYEKIRQRTESLGLSIITFENELRYMPVNALYK
jgi:hypothetical protein